MSATALGDSPTLRAARTHTQADFEQIDNSWPGSRGAEGEAARQLGFLVGQVGGDAQRHRRLFVGTIDDEPIAHISYSPVLGRRAGWMHDLSRRIPTGSPGLMEAINSVAIEQFREEGVQ